MYQVGEFVAYAYAPLLAVNGPEDGAWDGGPLDWRPGVIATVELCPASGARTYRVVDTVAEMAVSGAGRWRAETAVRPDHHAACDSNGKA